MSEGVERERRQESQENDRRNQPQVWIASLSDYNAGRLHGAWVSVDQEPNRIWEGVNEVLRTSGVAGAEEWAIFDYHGFGPLRLSEHESVERLSRLGLGIAEHGEAFAAFAHFVGNGDEQELLEQFEDCYLGQWESAASYTEELVDDVGIEAVLDEHVPEGLRPYVKVDVEGMARDMEIDGSLLSIESSEGGVFLFHPP